MSISPYSDYLDVTEPILDSDGNAVTTGVTVEARIVALDGTVLVSPMAMTHVGGSTGPDGEGGQLTYDNGQWRAIFDSTTQLKSALEDYLGLIVKRQVAVNPTSGWTNADALIEREELVERNVKRRNV